MAILKFSNVFLLRRPTLPIGSFTLDDSSLRKLWVNELVQEAIYMASPTLYEQLHQTVKNNDNSLPKPLRQSLQKYLLRMSTRSTPFGLFAGCAVGETGNITCVTVDATQPFIKYQRLDAAWLAEIVRQLNRLPAIQNQVRFFPNDSLYTVGDELRYIEYRSVMQDRHFFTSSVRQSVYLNLVLELAREGATVHELAASLVARKIPSDQAAVFVLELITQQLLVSALGVSLTETAPLAALSQQLRPLEGTLALVEALDHVAQLLTPVHTDSRSVKQAIDQVLEPYVNHIDQRPPTQTDLFLNTGSNVVSAACLQTISEQITRLLPLNQPIDNPLLTQFVNRFRSRYDQQEIPLLQVLDSESGIGYGLARGSDADYVALLDGFVPPIISKHRTVNWGPYEDLLMRKLSLALQDHCTSVSLTDAELQRIGPATPVQLPANFHVLGNLLASSPADIDNGNFSFNLLAAQGPSLANLLGRFCTYSTQLTENVKAYVSREEQQRPEAIFAEIIHTPHERLGNVLTRPALYRYEIPVVSPCAVSNEFRIDLNDLRVSVSPDNRVVLRSQRMQKEVIPRLSTAHNYQNSLPVYQFLCDLQRQTSSLNLHWDWGPLNEQPFLPRIVYQNIIVSRARWRIIPREYTHHSAHTAINHLQTRLRLPQWVALAEGDNELVFNLSRESDQQLLWEEVCKREACLLVEWLATPEQCWLRDEQGLYASEIGLSGSCEPSTSIPTYAAPPSDPKTADKPPRFFPPGSEWLYIKVYAGTRISHQLLTEVIWPLMRKLTDQHKLDGWFFVRYADPEPHLRLRCHLRKPRFFGSLVHKLTRILAHYQQTGLIHNVQLDTYERELERYGEDTISISEAIFMADSTAAMQYFCLEYSPEDHWLFALRTIDVLLTDFDQDLPARIRLLGNMRETLLAEHGADAAFRRQLNDRYRVHQRVIDQHLSAADQADDSPGQILALRSAAIGPEVAQLKAGMTSRDRRLSVEALLSSYIHMAMNRVFIAQQRSQELITYHHLFRYYESRLARNQSKH